MNMILDEGPSSVTGVETSDLAIDVVSRRHRQAIEQGELKLVRSNASAMPFEDGEFSKIFSVNVIYFWSNSDQVFQEINRVTATPGHVALCYQQQGPDKKDTFNPSQVERSLMSAGFSSTETTTAQDKWNGLYFCTIARKIAG